MSSIFGHNTTVLPSSFRNGMKKTMVGRDRVDHKRHSDQQNYRTTCQQKNLPGFLEIVKFALKRDAMTTNKVCSAISRNFYSNSALASRLLAGNIIWKSAARIIISTSCF